jgi:hypothetical protein
MFMSFTSLMAQAKKANGKVKSTPQVPLVVLGDVEKKKADILRMQNEKKKGLNTQEAKKVSGPVPEVNF